MNSKPKGRKEWGIKFVSWEQSRDEEYLEEFIREKL